MTSQNKNGESVFWVFWAVLPAMIVCSLWIHANNYYPRFDAADFLTASQKIFLTAHDDPWEAFKLVFWHKEHKPIIHPILLSLVLLLVGGRIFAAILFSNLLYVFFFGFFLFKTFRLWLDEKKSALGVFFLTTIPWYLWDAHTAFSEPLFLALCALTAGLAIASDWGRDKRATALGFLALTAMLCTRPVETVLLAAVPFAIYLYVGAKRRQWSRELAVRFAVYLGGMLSWFAFLWVHGRNLEDQGLNPLFYLYPLLPFCADIALRRRRKKKAWETFELALVLAYLILVVWYSPAIGSLKAWVIDSNFQQSANASSRRPGMSVFGYVWFYLKTLGGLPLLCFAVFAIPGVGALLERMPSWRFETGAAIACLAWVVFGPVLASSVSLNEELRYYQASIVALLAFLFVVFGRSSSRAFAGVALLALANLFHVVQPIFRSEREQTLFPQRLSLGFYSKELFPFHEKDPLESVAEWVDSMLAGRGASSPLSVHYWRLLAGGYDWDFGISAFQLIVQERSRSWRLQSEPPVFDERWQAQLQGFQEHFKLHLLGPIGETIPKQPDAITVNFYAEKIHERWKAGRLDEIGMRALGELELKIRDGKTFKFVLLESVR